MSGRGNTTMSTSKSKTKDKQTTRSGRAGLTFPVGRVVSDFFSSFKFIILKDMNLFFLI